MPVHPKSATWIASAARKTLDFDFGSPAGWGIPYNVVPRTYPKSTFQWGCCGGQSDPNPYLFDANTKVQSGGGGDGHAITVNKDDCVLEELFAAKWGSPPIAGQGSRWSLTSNALRPNQWTSTDDAGLPVFAGLMRYEEWAAGKIAHAMRFALQNIDSTRGAHLWPARFDPVYANTPNGNLPPMGARLRMKAGADLSGYSPGLQVILRALRDYGMLLADFGSDWTMNGTSDPRWNDALGSELQQVPLSMFEFVDESALQIEPDSGAARQSCAAEADASAPPPSTGDPVFIGAGDIAGGDSHDHDDQTANEIAKFTNATVFTLGDNAYVDGAYAEFVNEYGSSWGRFLDRTRPSVGNHDYHTPGAAGYFQYFGARAGDPAKGYYSYDLGAWHIVALNSNCAEIGGCNAGSPQEIWLRQDLAAHPAACTLAYWHHPYFTTGSIHGNATEVSPLVQALWDNGADVILNGHNHQYERFVPRAPSGQRDDARGLRVWVIGTGGAGLYAFASSDPDEAFLDRLSNGAPSRDNTAWGVLKLVLHPRSYDWQFLPTTGMTFTDVGSASCH